MADEIIDIVDESLTPLGTASKSEAHSVGLWHFSIHCWIYGMSDGRPFLLFQRRSPHKDLFPGCLDISAAGHYQHGETDVDGVREIAEELGLPVRFADLVSLGLRTEVVKIGPVLNREFCRVFLLRCDRDPRDYDPVDGEVDGLVAVPVDLGLRLFTGQVESVPCSGVEWVDGGWVQIDLAVDRSLFVTRYDNYYYKMFALADQAITGYPHLVI
jgi:isopentenyldiphosphate isomerase